jgi:hypothetical protein
MGGNADNYDKARSIAVAAVFAIVIGGFFVLARILTPPTFLESERRVPAKFPALSFDTIASAGFMDKFDAYAADNFPLREGLRTLRAGFVFGVYLQTDKDGLYMDAHGAGGFKPIAPDSVEQIARKIATVSDSLDGLNVYYAFIPDKSIYSDKYLPGFDADMTKRLLSDTLGADGYTFINLVDALNADSYYMTDLHWDQIALGGVLDALGSGMGFDADLGGYSEESAGVFEGVYVGQLALPIGMDELRFLSNPSITASRLNERTSEMAPTPVYDWDELSGIDPYSFFLSGAQPLIVLENGDSRSDKELYLFRDSFSSSLAPLLASAYSKVTLIDLRYMDMRTLARYVDFKPGSDALFLYSTLVLGNPEMLLVR